MSEDPSPDPATARNSIVLLAILVEGGLIGLAVVAGWLLDQPPLSRFSFDAMAVLWGIGATAPIVGLFFLMTRWPIGPLRAIKRFTDEVLLPILAPCSVVDLLGISCLAGLGEEMLFRGVVQDALAAQLPWWAALVGAGVLFGLLHAVTLSYAVLAALMGVYLGWLYEYTGNLLAPAITHALYDFFVLVYMLRGPNAPESEVPEEETTAGSP